MSEREDITPIGITNYRSINQKFGIRDKDRLGHIYVIGKTGTGKSTLLQNMAISDIERGNGMAVVDPHGDIAESLLEYIPEHRIMDVIYFNAAEAEFPIAFNPLSGVHSNYHHLVASGLISTFRKIWAESWGPRLEYILRYALLSLLSYPGATLLDIQPLLTSPEYRSHVLSYVKDGRILSFWKGEYDKYTASFRNEAIASVLNKMGVFASSKILRNILGQKERSFRMQQILDKGQILIVNLSKGKIGEDAASLLGSMLVTSIQLAALHRAEQAENKRRPFYLYVDEMQSFISTSFADTLAEARKYKLSLFLAHQYIEQINEEVRAAIFGNVGTIISFRLGWSDAAYLAKEFQPEFEEHDFVNLPAYSIYLKLLIDGVVSTPFSATTIPLKIRAFSRKQEVVTMSRLKYGRKGMTRVPMTNYAENALHLKQQPLY
jgi:energy-coupling factor transporter ATP-binding protein EcfA2